MLFLHYFLGLLLLLLLIVQKALLCCCWGQRALKMKNMSRSRRQALLKKQRQVEKSRFVVKNDNAIFEGIEYLQSDDVVIFGDVEIETENLSSQDESINEDDHKPKENKIRDLLLAWFSMVLAICSGSAIGPMFKYMEQNKIPPFLSASWRCQCMIIFLLPMALLESRLDTGASIHWWERAPDLSFPLFVYVFAAGMGWVGNLLFWISGLQYTTTVRASLIANCHPLLLVVLMCFTGRKISKLEVLGVLLSVGGLAITTLLTPNGGGEGSQGAIPHRRLLGDLLCLCAAAAEVVVITNRHLIKKYVPLMQYTTATTIMVTCASSLASLLSEGVTVGIDASLYGGATRSRRLGLEAQPSPLHPPLLVVNNAYHYHQPLSGRFLRGNFFAPGNITTSGSGGAAAHHYSSACHNHLCLLGWMSHEWVGKIMLFGFVVGCVCITGFNYAVQYISPLIFSSITLVEPLVTGGISWMAGLEALPDMGTWVGGFVVLGGVGLISCGEHCREAAESSAQRDDEEEKNKMGGAVDPRHEFSTTPGGLISGERGQEGGQSEGDASSILRFSFLTPQSQRGVRGNSVRTKSVPRRGDWRDKKPHEDYGDDDDDDKSLVDDFEDSEYGDDDDLVDEEEEEKYGFGGVGDDDDADEVGDDEGVALVSRRRRLPHWHGHGVGGDNNGDETGPSIRSGGRGRGIGRGRGSLKKKRSAAGGPDPDVQRRRFLSPFFIKSLNFHGFSASQPPKPSSTTTFSATSTAASSTASFLSTISSPLSVLALLPSSTSLSPSEGVQRKAGHMYTPVSGDAEDDEWT